MGMKPEDAFAQAIAVANSYTDETVVGGGAIKGKNCVVSSIDEIEGGHRVNFKSTLDDGTVKTDTMDVMDGVKGDTGETGSQGPQGEKGDKGDKGDTGEKGTDGKGIKAVAINEEEHLIITYTDDTTTDAGKIEVQSAVDSVNGKTGDVVLDASDVGALPNDTSIPSKTSELTNDSNFVADASYVHTDNNYDATAKGIVDGVTDALAGKVDKVNGKGLSANDYTNADKAIVDGVTSALASKANSADLATVATSGDYDDLIDKPTIPSALSDLTDDTTHRVVTDTEKTTWSGKQDTLTFDDVPTENSNNPVKSGGVYSANQNIYEVMGQMGTKNLITYPHSGKTETKAGITFTENADGSVTVNGTATEIVRHLISSQQFEVGKKYILSGCPSGGSHSLNGTYTLYTQTVQNYDDGEGVEFTWDASITGITIAVFAGITVDNLTFYPMIRLASDTDDTYVPYAKTNQQLTQDTTSLLDSLEVNGAVNMLPPRGVSEVITGITFTANSDGSISASGTATANTYYNVPVADVGQATKAVSGKIVKMSGCPSGGSASTYALQAYIRTSSDGNVSGGQRDDFGNGTTFTVGSDQSLRVQIFIATGQTVSGLTFKPMITVPSYNGDYVPYAKSNRELTEDTASAIVNVPNGAINLAKPNSAGTTTVSNVEFVIDSEGKVTANGTASANIRFDMAEVTLKAGRTYKICEPSSLQARRPFNPETYRCYARIKSSGVWVLQNNGWKGSYTPTEDVVVSVGIAMQSGNEVTDEIFAPMIVLVGTDVGDTFYPYAMTNRELTKDVTSLDAMYDGKTPSAVSDLNVPLTAGGASVAITRHLNNTTNAPTNGGGLEITWSSSDKYGAQLTLTDSGLYFRFNSSGTISAWQKIST